MKTQLILLTVLLLTTGLHTLRAQNKLEGTVNVSGACSVINGQMFEFNIGEMVLVETFYGSSSYAKTNTNAVGLSQGFLQPVISSIGVNSQVNNDVLVKNNIISPNNDGVNDVFVIEGLDKHPGSKMYVYDKAGRMVFSATDYKNNWCGEYKGNTLNEDAYYYVIDLGNNTGLIKGSVSIILDK